jgi:hypothetical protein
MSLDRRFALITLKGEVLYPYQKTQRATGRYGFALTQTGNQDRHGGGVYTTDLSEVIRHVVWQGWGVRARSESGRPDGSYMLGQRAVQAYWVSPEWASLVQGAPIAPVPTLPGAGNEQAEDEDPLEQVDRLTSEDFEPEPGLALDAAQAELDADPQAAGLSKTERLALLNARLGQGAYRQRMIRLWGHRCAVSECAMECVLIASHAKPWKSSTNTQRLDPYNGLLLAASIDRLFDQGWISFTDQGELLCKPGLSEEALTSVGMSSGSRLRFVHEKHRPYLQAHRALHGFEVVSEMVRAD